MRRTKNDEERTRRIPELALWDREKEPVERPRILLLEDNAAMRVLLAETLLEGGYEVVESDRVAPWIDRILRGEAPETAPAFDLVVSDIRMPGRSGLELLEGLRQFDFLLPVILITAYGSPETHREARRLGATLLDKPFEMEQLLALVADLCPPPEEESGYLSAVGL